MFSSGHDLKELTGAQGRDYHTEVFQTCSEVSQGDGQHPKHGSCYCVKYRGSLLVSDKSTHRACSLERWVLETL